MAGGFGTKSRPWSARVVYLSHLSLARPCTGLKLDCTAVSFPISPYLFVIVFTAAWTYEPGRDVAEHRI